MFKFTFLQFDDNQEIYRWEGTAESLSDYFEKHYLFLINKSPRANRFTAELKDAS